MSADCPVYRAERAAWAACPVLTATVDPHAFVAWVATKDPFLSLRRRHRPECHLHEPVGVVVGDRRTTRALAWPGHQCIELPEGPVTQSVLLHELAHMCLPDNEGHSRQFAAVHLELTQCWLGEWASTILARAYREHGVL